MPQTITLRHGDSFELLKGIPDNSVAAFILDPPYMIGFMNKGWDDPSSAFDEEDEEVEESVDAGGIQRWHGLWLKEAYRCLIPNGVVKAFAATRTQHRLSVAMESCGLILDPSHSYEAWAYGSGFPKSTNMSKVIDKRLGKTGDRKVVGTARGVGGENMNDIVRGTGVIRSTNDPGGRGVGAYGVGAKQTAITIDVTVGASDEARKFEGFGTSLKPAWEPFIVGRKPI